MLPLQNLTVSVLSHQFKIQRCQ